MPSSRSCPLFSCLPSSFKNKMNEEKSIKNGSLSAAMRGMEDEESLYSESDAIELLG